MAKAKDITGMRFGRLVATERVEGVVTKSRNALWRLRCDCGNDTTTTSGIILRGAVRSCGCLQREGMSQRATRHGILKTEAGVRTLAALRNAIYRCENPRNKRYPAYGGRGIAVCDRWKESPTDFVADMGECPPGYTLERIDCNGHYEPTNCKWASFAEQAANRRACWRITYNGRQMTLAEYAAAVGIHYATAKKKLGAAFGLVRTVNLDKAA